MPDAKHELTKILGIGDNLAQHLIGIGFTTIELLKGQDPEELYMADCTKRGLPVDRCVLYCYRLAVHYADYGGQLPPDKQNWWNWKD